MSRNMKDSGVEWIGEVPADWEVAKLKNFVTIGSGEYIPKEDYYDNGAFEIVGSNGVIGRTKHKNNTDRVITTGRVGTIGTVNIVEEAWITDNVLIIRPAVNINTKYLYHVLSTIDYKTMMSGTAQPLITATNLKNQYFSFPNSSNQPKVANFLDQKVAEIDHIIAKTQASIEEYKRYKQSIITEAVTKGLNPNVPMKDSGIEWIGEIPEHWDIVKIKNTTETPDTSFLDGDWIESDIITDKGIRYLTTGNIGEGYFKEQGNGFISEETLRSMGFLVVFPGDLIISRLNRPVGRACILPNLHDRYVIAVDNVLLRPNPKLYSKGYLKYVMNIAGYNEEANMIARGATMPRISKSMLGNLQIPCPSRDTQEKIASLLDDRVEKIEHSIGEKERLICNLESYKQSLIYEVVTGKKEVM